MTNIFSAPLKLMFLLGSILPIHSSKSIYTGSDHADVSVSPNPGTTTYRRSEASGLAYAPARSRAETPPATGPKTSPVGQRTPTEKPARLGPDPIRFSIQCDKRQIAIDEEVNLTITAQLLTITPNQLFFTAGAGAYTLKLILPPGFEQTGGDVIDYVAGNLSATGQSVMTYRVRGRFRSLTPGTSFRLLRSHGQANDQSIFTEKSVVTLQGLSGERDDSRLRKMATGPADPGEVTLFVTTDKTATGAARAGAAGDYRGYLDYAACDAVSGWIVNRNELRKSQEVDIYINGVKAATVLADQARRDVATSFGVNDFSAYGYVWVIPDYYKANVALSISARPAETGSDLTNSPRRTSVCPGNGTPPSSGTTTAPATTTTPPVTTTTTPPVTTTTATPGTGGALIMLAPTYNCSSGAITFNTSGGDGTPIRFRATGISDWSTNPNQFLDAGSRVNADTPPFTIYFEQSGRVATYTWSRQATCTSTAPPVTTPPVTTPPVTTPPVTTPPVTTPPVGTLTMLAPTYNCSSGAITFNTSGGDGTPIRFRATGITGWTTNPNQFLDAGSRVNADTPTFMIYFEQSGRVFTYNWSRQATCTGSTPATPPPTPTPPTTTPTPPPTTPGACAASISKINYNWDGGNSSISIVLNASAGSPQIKLSGPTSIDWTGTASLGNSTWFWANQNMNSGNYTLSVRQAGDTGTGCSFSFSVPGNGRQLYPVVDGGEPATPAPCTSPSAPTVNAPNGTQVCNNSTVTLNASGCSGTTTWSGGQTGSSINVGSAGTYTATCTVNGCVSGASNQLTVTACAPPTNGARYNRVLYVGNSITLHGGNPFFIVNAQNPKRGMAATSPDRDYVHLMSARHRSLNGSVENRTLASWDMGGQLDEATGPHWEGNSTKNGIDLARFDPVANWKPDIVYIRLGENVADEELTNQPLYQSRLKALIDKLISQSPGAKVVLSTSVWGKSNYDSAIRAVAAERNYPLADFTSMWPNRLINGYYALGVYGDAGTDNHPDDDGMAHMADGLWNATPK